VDSTTSSCGCAAVANDLMPHQLRSASERFGETVFKLKRDRLYQENLSRYRMAENVVYWPISRCFNAAPNKYSRSLSSKSTRVSSSGGLAAGVKRRGRIREGKAFPHCGHHRCGDRLIIQSGAPIFSHFQSLPALRAAEPRETRRELDGVRQVFTPSRPYRTDLASALQRLNHRNYRLGTRCLYGTSSRHLRRAELWKDW
jgi:hypothetical protein